MSFRIRGGGGGVADSVLDSCVSVIANIYPICKQNIFVNVNDIISFQLLKYIHK